MRRRCIVLLLLLLLQLRRESPHTLTHRVTAAPAPASIAAQPLPPPCAVAAGSDPYVTQIRDFYGVHDADAPFSSQEMALLADIIRGWYGSVIEPALTAATTDDTQLDEAITGFEGWRCEAGRVGIPDATVADLVQAGLDLITRGLQNALQQASARCVAKHNPYEVKAMAHGGGLAGRLGLDTRPELDTATVFDRVRRCASFELDFDSRTTWLSSDGATTRMRVRAHVTLTLVTVGGGEAYDIFTRVIPPTFVGEARSEHVLAESAFANWPCAPVIIGVIDVTMRVPRATIELNDTSVRPVTLVFDPGQPQERMEDTTCRDPSSHENDIWETEWWRSNFDGLHQDEFTDNITTADATGGSATIDGSAAAFLIRDWDYVGGPVFARKLYQRSVDFGPGSGLFSEDTRFELQHTPKP